MMPTQCPQGIHISGDGLALDGDHTSRAPAAFQLPRPAVARKRQLACCCRLDGRVLAPREPRAVPSQPRLDQRLGHVQPAAVAGAHTAPTSALAGEVADHRLALDQLDHERLGCLAAGLACLACMRHLGSGHALQADVDAGHADGIAVGHLGTAGQALAGGNWEG